MQTFKDLYTYLQLYEENTIITWLEKPWDGKDKQESILRLFAGLVLIDKLKSYDICKGNYNEKCDCWSMGIILYMLLVGDVPFNDHIDARIYEKIIDAPINLESKVY